MKKKIFSIFMLLLVVSMGAWATEKELSPVGVLSWTNTPAITYDGEATSWAINQGGISGGKLGKYAGPYAIVKFDASSILDGMTLLSATLDFDITAGAYNSSINIAQMSDATFTPSTVTVDDFDATATQFQSGDWSTKNTTIHFSYDVKARVEANNVLAFAIYTNTGREQTLKDVKLVLNYSDAPVAKYNYSLKAVTSEALDIKTLAEGEEFETNSATLYFPYMFYNESTLYTTATKPYSVTVDKDNANQTVTYAADGGDIVAYMEGEAAEANSGFDAAYSNGKTGHAAGNKTVTIATLPAGKYTATINFVANGNRSCVIRNTANTDVATNAIVSLPIDKNSSAGIYTSDEFTLTEETTIGFSGYTSDTKTNQSADIDYIFIEKTGEYVPVVTSYAVTISDEIENGTVVADPTSANAGAEVTLTNTPAEGYEFVSYSVTCKTIDEAVIVTDGKFTMPADDVTVSATFQLPAPATYAVTIADGIVGGTVAADPTSAKEGDEVTLINTPAEGYELVSVSVTGVTSNEAVIVTDGKFTMPADDVTVSATFKKKAIYIETDLTSQFSALTDYTKWTGATGFTATNFCPAVAINDGTTKQVCEKYEGTCATTGDVFYQTITGLAAGTYKIELYGGAAYTFGRGFSSEAFSEGTWNAGDKIEPSAEVSTGVVLSATTSEGTYGGEIPIYYATNFPDGAATVTLDGVKVGANGELRIGMSKTSQSTNWHVVQLKGVTAQVDAIELHAVTLASAQAALSAEENAVVVGEEKTALEAAIANNSEVTEQTSEAYETAINALKAATNAFTSAREAYAALASTKETLVEYAKKYVYASAEKTAAVTAAAEGEPTSAADATSKNANLITALRAMAESHANAEGVEGAEAIAITNPSAEDSTNGWTTVNGEGSDGSIGIRDNEPWTSADGSTAHKYFDGGNWGASAWDVSLTQDVELAAGKYMLSAIGRASGDVALTIFAGESKTTMPSIGAAGGLFDRGWNISSVEFEVNANSTVTIGVQGVTSVIHNWMSFSDFHLVLLEAIPEYAVTIAEGIEGGSVVAEPAYAKQGVEVTLINTPAEGYEFVSYSVKGVKSNEAVLVTDGKFTMPADDVTVSAEFKAVDPSGDEEIALAADMFYTWDGDGADASKIASATVDFNLGKALAQGEVVAGTGGVDYLTYADMTGSTKVIFEGKDGTAIRLLMNRQESNNGPLVEKNATITDGKAEISLTDLDFVHVNAIKINWGAPEGSTINSITFVKPNDPLAGPKEALKDAIAAAKMQNSVAKTEESFAALTKAITDGEAALADAEATVESLTTAKSDIETAVKGLTLAEGYAEVTKEMFKQYASVDEPGEGTATGGAYELFTASGLPYGDGSVSELKWADLTKYDKLIVTVAGNVAPRLCMNRLVKDGQQAATQEDSKMLDINPNNGNTWSTEKYQTASDGVYTIDLAAIVKDYTFARLHCIKAQGGGSTVVTGMYLHEAPVTYDITVAEGIVGGTVAADPTSAKEGDEVTLINTPAEGYEFVSYSVTGKTTDVAVIVTDGKFTMPADDVTVGATFKKKAIYIETDLTSQFSALTNWQNWTGATGFTATNFCPAVAINDGTTKQVCEKYEGTCATTGDVFYQTITGLAAGTYKIELYGGAAYTFGRGFSSEAFSEGTWNAGDKIEPSAEVSTGVVLSATTSEGTYGGEIPIYYATNFPDGAATVTLDGVKVGANGELRIGMSKTSQSTNWHVVQLKGVTAQVDAIELHAVTLASAQAALSAEENAVVVGEEKTALEAAIANHSEVTELTSEAYETAINALKAATNAFTSAREAYAALASTKETLVGYAEKYVYASAEKTAAVTAAAEGEPTSAADATSKNANLITALRAMAESHANAEGVEGAEAIAITNPSAEDSTNGWTTVNGEGSDGSIGIRDNEPWTSADGSTAHKYFDGGNWGASAWDVSLTQNVELAAGKYMLSAIGRASGDVALTIFAGESKTTMPSIGAAGGLFDRGWNISSVEFEVNANSTVTIGVQGVTSVIHNWMSFSDFKLVLIESYAVKVAKAELLEAINKAKAIDTEGKNGAKELATAITVAEGVYNNEEATVEGVNTAKSDLAAAVAAFDEANKVYAVNVDAEIENGTVAVNPTSAKAGDEVTITATPAEGYELASITVTGVASEEIVEVTDGKFTMPADDVTVTATFVQTTGIDAASAAKGKKIGVKKYFKNGELIIIGKDGKEFRANGAAK